MCQYRRHEFDPWVRRILLKRKWQPTLAFLPKKSHRQRSLVGYSPWSHKRVGYNLVTKKQYVYRQHIAFRDKVNFYLQLFPTYASCHITKIYPVSITRGGAQHTIVAGIEIPGSYSPSRKDSSTSHEEYGWLADSLQVFDPSHLHFGASQVVPVVKNPTSNTGDVRGMGSIPELGRSPERGLGNPMDRAA